MENNKSKNMSCRGYLPHIDKGSVWQSLTLRIKGSLPAAVLADMKRKILTLPEQERKAAEAKLVEKYLDDTANSGLLKQPNNARAVVDVISRFDGQLYELAAFVVMSNHVHLLFELKEEVRLSQVIMIIKSLSARRINELQNEKGRIWERDYFDRYIRDSEHWFSVLDYIENNPVKAGLCLSRRDYQFSSAYYRGKRKVASTKNYKLKFV